MLFLNLAAYAGMAAAVPAVRSFNTQPALPVVTVAEGPIQGSRTSLSAGGPVVTKYAGIPFAASPIRFAPPQAPATRTTTLAATTTQPACIQQFIGGPGSSDRVKAVFNNPGLPPPAESEDCLYLNVYVPPGTTSTSGKASLFWIFGGNLQFGTGGLAYYDGTAIAGSEDVIVVTPNYRTNVFGFPNAPAITDTAQQNPGFLDQRAALQWWHKNARAFGADPARVTIFGESAGGWSVKQLLALPPSGPSQFSGAIMESEAVTNSYNGAASWTALQTQLGCLTVDCVRKVDAQKIKSIIEQQSLLFPPQINGVTAVNDVRPSITSGTFAKVPFMLGTNKDEGRAFAYVFGLDDTASSATTLAKLGVPDAVANAGYYGFSDALTYGVFQCPAAEIASLATAHGYGVWRYRFEASFPNVNTFPNAGAYHSVEIPEVFGTYPTSNIYGSATQNQINLSTYMRRAWGNFAKSRNPGADWPSYASNAAVQVLGGASAPASGFTSNAAAVDTNCTALAPAFKTVLPL
ncbi:hypothetical protein PYCC9005_002335 [Savitreella phatthalungensis]